MKLIPDDLGGGGASGGPPMGMPPDAAPEMSGPPAGSYPIPVKALAQPDDQEAMQTPAQGDSVSFQVDGIIQSIQGEMAYVKPSAVNGTPVGDKGNEPNPDDDMAQEGAGLQQEAAGMSQ